MKKIIVIGSINVDNVMYTSNMPVPGMTVYGDSFLSNVGGKGANQACAIHFLNNEVDFYGAIGKDNNGKMVQNFLKEAGLTANLKVCDKVCTGVASILIDKKNAENQIVCVPGANVEITKEDIDKIAGRLTAPGLGRELVSYEGSYRTYYQGLFMAPHTVAQAL